MIIYRYPDGSEGYYYEEGDLVVITENDYYRTLGIGYKVGEWGKVRLEETKDLKNGGAGVTSFVRVIMAGVSTPKDSFIYSQKVPAWNLHPCIETYKQAIILEGVSLKRRG